MSGVLYLHHGGGRPAFYISANGSDKPLHGTFLLKGGMPVVWSAAPVARGFSVRELKDAGYQEICDVESLAGFVGETPMPDDMNKIILAWLAHNTQQKEGRTPVPPPPPPEPQASESDAWNW